MDVQAAHKSITIRNVLLNHRGDAFDCAKRIVVSFFFRVNTRYSKDTLACVGDDAVYANVANR